MFIFIIRLPEKIDIGNIKIKKSNKSKLFFIFLFKIFINRANYIFNMFEIIQFKKKINL